MDKIILGILACLFFVMTAVMFCLFIIRLYIKKIKAYTRLELDSQKAINTAIHETQEQTLNNISQDLHDDAGQQLTYINFQLENLKLDSPEMHTALEPLSDSVTRLSASIRSISHALNNQLLLQQDLFKAIRSEAERIEKNAAIKISFTASPTTRDFDNNEKIIIYRIFQEAINNGLKHAKATVINIKINSQPFEMTITDNGKGFLPEQNGNTFGLQGMAKRAKIVNYNFNIESVPGNGTTISLTENP